MKQMWVALFGVALAIGLAVEASPADAKQTPLKPNCKNGGWQYLVDAEGHSFRNQGGCVSFVAEGGTPHPLAMQLALSGTGSATVTSDPDFHTVGSLAVSGQVNPGGATSGSANFALTADGSGQLVGPPAPNSFVVQLAGGTITGHTSAFSVNCVANCDFPPTAGFTDEVTSTVTVDAGTGQFAGYPNGSLEVHYFAVLNGFGPTFTEDINGATISGTLTP